MSKKAVKKDTKKAKQEVEIVEKDNQDSDKGIIFSRYISVKKTQKKLITCEKNGIFAEGEFARAWSELLILSQREPNIAKCPSDQILKVMIRSIKSTLSLISYPPEAYVVVRKDKTSGHSITFQADYRGLLKIIYANSDIFEINPIIVFAADEFENTLDNIHFKQVEIDRTLKDIDDVRFVGVILTIHRLIDGVHIKTHFFASQEEIKKRKSVSASRDKFWGPWPEPMAIKTAIHMYSKFAEMKTEAREKIHMDILDQVEKADVDLDTGQIIEKRPTEKIEVDTKDYQFAKVEDVVDGKEIEKKTKELEEEVKKDEN